MTRLGVLVVALSVGAPSIVRGECRLRSARGEIEHVVYIVFDNMHLRRDDPNVPSDLEQMPNLLNFLTQQGTLLTNHHTPLISHTATDILTGLTGVYGDRHGVPVSNSFRYFNPDGTSNPGVSFAYWTAPIFDPSNPLVPTDTTPNMLTREGLNAPAPWVPYTRAGCDFATAANPNIVLENIAIDIPTVFGPDSPEAHEAMDDPPQAFADFVGIGLHCAIDSARCAEAQNGKPDPLPDEPGGYVGYRGLFGHVYVAPLLDPSGPLRDLDGNIIDDGHGHIGFPGFYGMHARVTLSYVAQMLEAGIPVVYAYISDAHDNHAMSQAYGPGEAGYVQALREYGRAFAQFFARLAQDGINSGNTLFVITSDENDHYVGRAGSPQGCDGINLPCTFRRSPPDIDIGELTANLTGLLARQGITTPFLVHSDSAPTIYITGNPARDTSATREFGRALARIEVPNVFTGQIEHLNNYLADPVEMNLLHLVTADPARTPTLTMFAKPDYFVVTGPQTCSDPDMTCITQNPAFAWNHGDNTQDIVSTWAGIVGPGVQRRGLEGAVWSDHADLRPTLLSLLGLSDDYGHQGRLVNEIIHSWALPREVRRHEQLVQRLGAVYKQLNAPVGALGFDSLRISSFAVSSGDPTQDVAYAIFEGYLQGVTERRNHLPQQIERILDEVTFGNQPIDPREARALIAQGTELIEEVHQLAEAVDH